MREKYLTICSFAKSRNMQIILFVLISIVYLVCVVFEFGISYFLYLPNFTELQHAPNIFLFYDFFIFFLNFYTKSFLPFVLYSFLSFFSIYLYYKTFEKIINNTNIFLDLLFLFFFIVLFIALFATFSIKP